MWIVIEVVAGLTGCGLAARAGGGSAQIATDLCTKPNLCPAHGTSCGVETLLCPDGTTNCCSTNGTGIYTAEGGFAGMNIYQSPPVGQPPFIARKIMIAHFQSVTAPAPQVTFQVGYFDPGNQWIVLGDGNVVAADYGAQHGLQVQAVHELATSPTWTLADPASGSTIAVAEAQLGSLQLHLSLPDGWGGTVLAALDFQGPPTHPPDETPEVHSASMRWRNETPGATTDWQPCCLDSARAPDSVVFQQDIVVDPSNGQVGRPSPGVVVTLSCFRGAPATVYGWHYPYTGPDQFHFAAGIQMKRASYCGDTHYYTTSGTAIDIADDQRINRGTHQSDLIQYLEAAWSPQGATCVNLPNLRHRAMGFTGSCGGVRLPACPAGPPAPPYLIAGPRSPGP